MFLRPLEFDKMAANLERLNRRFPEVSAESVLLSRLFIYLGRGMSAMLEQAIKPFDLSEAEFRILTILLSQADGSAHPGDLCANTSQTPANMSRLSDSLVARHFITREMSERDRRRMVLRITPEGEALVEKLLPTLSVGLNKIFGDFAPDEQRRLLTLLKTVAVAVSGELSADAAERAP